MIGDTARLRNHFLLAGTINRATESARMVFHPAMILDTLAG